MCTLRKANFVKLWATYWIAKFLTELYIHLKIDHRRVTKFEGLKSAKEGSGFLFFTQARKYWVRGAAAFIQKFDLLIIQTTLSDQIPGENVKDTLAIQFDAEEQGLTQFGTCDVLTLSIDDTQENLRLRSSPIDNGRGDPRVTSGIRRVTRTCPVHSSINISDLEDVKREKSGLDSKWMRRSIVEGGVSRQMRSDRMR